MQSRALREPGVVLPSVQVSSMEAVQGQCLWHHALSAQEKESTLGGVFDQERDVRHSPVLLLSFTLSAAYFLALVSKQRWCKWH